MPIATSFDASGRYGLHTPFSEGISHLWKGSMWHVDGSHNSLITAGNGGTGPTHAAVTLFYNQGESSYTIEQQLEPGEQVLAAHNGHQSPCALRSGRMQVTSSATRFRIRTEKRSPLT